jgi:chromosome segregation ATPase
MTEPLLIDCDAVLGTFRQWQAEQEPIEAQLSESLAALSAYQSHLDGWQQQLVHDREELRILREQWQRELGEADQDRSRASELAGDLAAARDEIATLTTRLQSGEEELRAQRERFEREQEAALNSSSETSVSLANELNAARLEIGSLTTELNSRAEELRAAHEQIEHGSSAADSSQARLAEITKELAAARDDFASLMQQLEATKAELLTEQQRVEQSETASEHNQTQLTELTAELNTARDKVAELSASLLLRTEELRTVDVCRAEAVAELDRTRLREQELAAALEELHSAQDGQQSGDSFSESNERLEAEQTVDPLSTPRPSENRDSTRVARPGESPVFASVKEQFGKLRQQRAMDRPAPKKAR